MLKWLPEEGPVGILRVKQLPVVALLIFILRLFAAELTVSGRLSTASGTADLGCEQTLMVPRRWSTIPGNAESRRVVLPPPP